MMDLMPGKRQALTLFGAARPQMGQVPRKVVGTLPRMARAVKVDLAWPVGKVKVLPEWLPEYRAGRGELARDRQGGGTGNG